MTNQEKVLRFLVDNPGSTATQVAKAVNERSGTISSLMNRLVRDKILYRENFSGPRGGYAYFLRDTPNSPKTLWERLIDEPAQGEHPDVLAEKSKTQEERDRYREALTKIANTAVRLTYDGNTGNAMVFYEDCMNLKNMARRALSLK